jgi:nucleoside-diphosphate-sugar epimerase
MPRALILGGTGAIGRATARRLLVAGWRVDLTGRDPAHLPAGLAAAGARFITADRGGQDGDLDLLVDCVCFTAEDAASLLPLARRARSTVMISSKAVYVDDEGRHANSAVPPHFGGPIRETQPTLPPGGGDYRTAGGYGPNKVAAERVLLDSGLPVTVLRPSKIHGAGARQPREWLFVRQVLDRRPAVFLAHRGGGVDHTTAAASIAALIEVVADRPGARILNSADPDAPSALRIARTVARHLDHAWDEILLHGNELGRHPWDKPHPVVLDMTAALDLGYAPAGDYAATVSEEIDWLVSAARGGADADLLPELGLDYQAEDRWLRSKRSPA